MRRTRVDLPGRFRSLALALSTVVVAALLTASTATADTAPGPAVPDADQLDTDPVVYDSDRANVVALWRAGGPTVRADAERALAGTDADIQAFLTTTLPRDKAIDDRIATDRILTAGGSAVKTAAQQALDSTAADATSEFVQSGWQVPAKQDERIQIDRMIATGGTELRNAAQQALDNGTQPALERFLSSGWQTPFGHDQRIRVNQLLASGGPEVRAAAQRALDADTLDALTQFIDADYEVAAARDQETDSVAQLAGAAQDAGAEAARETQAAKDAADRAVAQAALARQAAEAAAQASANAQHDATAAAAAANQAADAAAKAADAAREAVGAANAASSAARIAANAAARAAAAASKARQAASNAYSAASSAATNAGKAADARQAAQAARDVAAGAQQAADAAAAAGNAAQLAQNAVTAAHNAGNDANSAATAANTAATNAAAAGADAGAARSAAATATANAARANRAANAAGTFAATAVNAAFAARDAAHQASLDATAAAAAADDAADHAGQAADAAQQATNHANAATQAAQAAITAANQAQGIYDAARSADSERIAVQGQQDDEAALAATDAVNRASHQARWDSTQAALRTAETTRLVAEATNTATDPALALTDARKIAKALAEVGGPWTKAAALAALAGPADLAMSFVRDGIGVAAGQDDRLTLQDLANTGPDGYKAAVATALAGSDADVTTLLQTGSYPGRATDDRIAVDRILSAAQQSGATTLAQSAQTALDNGTDDALRTFLDKRQYSAASTDDRINVNRILADAASGPELKNAAQTALDGTTGMLHQFLLVGRYTAAQHDQAGAAHNALVAGYLQQASRAAATAAQNADTAQSVAATARGAAADAAGYAQQANNDAAQAATYAQQAHNSATQAAASAQAATNSAATASTAAAAATTSAHNATQSSIWAQTSARQAAGFAANAYGDWQRAYTSATDAGHNAETAIEAAKQAVDVAKGKINDEKRAQRETVCRQLYGQGSPDYTACLDGKPIDPDIGSKQLARGEQCVFIAFPGIDSPSVEQERASPAFQNCIRDTLNPNFEADQAALFSISALDDLVGGFNAYSPLELAGVIVGGLAGAVCEGSVVCGIALDAIAAVSPAIAPLVEIGASATGVAAAVGTERAVGAIEDVLVESEATDGAIADELSDEAAAGFRDDGCTPNSFTADTRVLLADGHTAPISTITPGTLVAAADPAHQQPRTRPVTEVIDGQGTKHLVTITIATNTGAVQITSTTAHPFWVDTLHTWIKAGRLTPGQQLHTGGGELATITQVRQHVQAVHVYNLTVDDVHNYYVQAGATPILVHNDLCSDNAKKLRKNLVSDSGQPAPPNTAAHHIVMSTRKPAEPARLQLEKFGIDLNSSANGVFLPQYPKSPNPTGASIHANVHSDKYIIYVNNRLTAATSREEALAALDDIRQQLLAGQWP